MTWLLPIAVAISVGFILAFQPAVNSSLAMFLNSAFAAAAFSLLLSSITVFVFFCLSGASIAPGQFLNLPWWVIFGGIIGAAFVSSSIFLVPVMGATVFFVCLIAGQLVGAVVADAIGAFGLEVRTLSVSKFVGVVLAFVGVFLVRWG